jgi:hypothetical protein
MGLRRVRRQAAPVRRPTAAGLATALLGSFLVLGHASPASARCAPDIGAPYHDANSVAVHLLRTCGHEYRAWGNWGGADIDAGRYKTTGFVHACDVAACVTHPDGKLAEGGWQREGRPRHCSFGCPAPPGEAALLACSLSLPTFRIYHGAQTTVWQSCGHPAWVWAFVPGGAHPVMYGPHRTAPPGAPKYSVVQGTGRATCGGYGLYYNGRRHYRVVFGTCTGP